MLNTLGHYYCSGCGDSLPTPLEDDREPAPEQNSSPEHGSDQTASRRRLGRSPYWYGNLIFLVFLC